MEHDEIHQGLELLGIDPQELADFLTRSRVDEEQAKIELEEFQTRARKLYKIAAIRLHPDQGGDSQLFDLATKVYKALCDLRTVRRPLRPAIPVYGPYTPTSAAVTSTYSGGTTSGGRWTPVTFF